jgi:hypothetical protein
MGRVTLPLLPIELEASEMGYRVPAVRQKDANMNLAVVMGKPVNRSLSGKQVFTIFLRGY